MQHHIYSEIFPEYLPVKLTDAERMKRGIENGEIQEKIRKSEEEFAEMKRNHAGEIKEMQSKCRTLGEAARTGAEDRMVDCKRVHDYQTCRITVFRTDTGAMIEDRPMTSVERQMRLGYVGPFDLAPSTPEKAQTEEPTVAEPQEPTPEAVEEAVSFLDVEWVFKEEVAAYEPEQLREALTGLEGEADTPKVSMKRKVLRDEINRRDGCAPNEFGVYKDLEQIQVLSKEVENWRVYIQTLETPSGWIHGFNYHTQFEQTGGEVLTSLRVYESQSAAIYDAAWRLKVLNKKDKSQTGEQRRAAMQICEYCDQVIAEHATSTPDENKDDGESASAASGD